jgi:DNA relaxase NicK
MQGKVITQARKMTPIESKDKKGNGQGKTVNIGSRTSEAFLRVYDKGAEQGTDVDWTRVELETKGRLADLACVRMGQKGIRRAGCALIRKFVSIPDLEWYTDLLSGAGEMDTTLRRKESDWDAWVRAVALPNVIKAIQAGLPGVREAVERAIQLVDIETVQM